MAKTDFKSVKEYIASKPRDVRGILKRVRSFELDQILMKRRQKEKSRQLSVMTQFEKGFSKSGLSMSKKQKCHKPLWLLTARTSWLLFQELRGGNNSSTMWLRSAQTSVIYVSSHLECGYDTDEEGRL